MTKLFFNLTLFFCGWATITNAQVNVLTQHNDLNLFCGKSIKTGSGIFVYNSLGQMVIRTQVTGTVSEINTSRLPSGVYQIHLVTDGKKITKSFIKSLK